MTKYSEYVFGTDINFSIKLAYSKASVTNYGLMSQDNNVGVETSVENLKNPINAKRGSIVKAELTKIIRMEGYKIKLLI